MRQASLMRVTLACALTAALATSLVACGSSNPKPAPLPSKTVNASPTGEVAPPMPPEAKGNTAASAMAFVRHYLAVLSYASRTGQASALRPLAADTCETCSKIEAKIRSVYAAGGWLKGRGYRVEQSNLRSKQAASVTLTVMVYQFPQTALLKKGAKPQSFGRAHLKSIFSLSYSGGKWLLEDWTGA